MSVVQHRRPAAVPRETDVEIDIERRFEREPTAVNLASTPDLDKTLTTESDEPPPDADVEKRVAFAWRRFKGSGRKVPSFGQSLKNIARHSILNILVVFVPLSWIGHFVTKKPVDGEDAEAEKLFSPFLQFAFSFLAIMPLAKTFDWLGEQMPPYVGAELGELLECTLNNMVEALLAIFLLTKDRYRLLQSTIAGVVLLHLLLIPGVSFMTGGARIMEQQLHGRTTELNHSLLTLGVMTLILPAAFFAALDRGNLVDLTHVVLSLNQSSALAAAEDNTFEGGAKNAHVALLSDASRGQFLSISRALAVLLLFIYVCSRIYIHNPPKDADGSGPAAGGGSEGVARRALRREAKEPEIGPWAGVVCIVVCVAMMGVVAEWLVDSIEDVQNQGDIRQEWFGLFLLPILSFAADGLLAVIFFIARLAKLRAEPPETAASGLAIDLAIQFLLFWSPALVLIAWWSNKPLSLLFDLFEVVVLVAACFLVNYVTADAKTNWVEGALMSSFYLMIAVCAWYYPGQTEVRMFVGRGTVADAVINGPKFE